MPHNEMSGDYLEPRHQPNKMAGTVCVLPDYLKPREPQTSYQLKTSNSYRSMDSTGSFKKTSSGFTQMNGASKETSDEYMRKSGSSTATPKDAAELDNDIGNMPRGAPLTSAPESSQDELWSATEGAPVLEKSYSNEPLGAPLTSAPESAQENHEMWYDNVPHGTPISGAPERAQESLEMSTKNRDSWL